MRRKGVHKLPGGGERKRGAGGRGKKRGGVECRKGEWGDRDMLGGAGGKGIEQASQVIHSTQHSLMLVMCCMRVKRG